MKQMTMFPNGEDLPLFTGAAPGAKVKPFNPKPITHTQEKLPANCHFCQDTGVLGEFAFCWCEVGQARKAARSAS